MRIVSRIATGVLIGGLLALLVFGVVKKAPSNRIDSRLAEQIATPTPSFKLAVLRGSEGASPRLRAAVSDGWLTTSELRGGPTVLNFWASWCQPCREEAEFLERTSRAAQRDGIVFVGVNVLDVKQSALEFMDEFGVSYLNVRDPSLKTATKFEAKAMPETFFLSSQGQIVGHAIGVVTPDQMIRGLKAAKAGRPIAVARGGATRSVQKQ